MVNLAPRRGRGRKPPTGKGSRKQAGGLPPWFEQLDADGDGQISFAEWRTDLLPCELFHAMDLNGDGLLTPAEYLRFMKQKPETIPIELKLCGRAAEKVTRPTPSSISPHRRWVRASHCRGSRSSSSLHSPGPWLKNSRVSVARNGVS